MDSHFQPAKQYFAFLAKAFPVMCASDEFDFMPRAEDASMYYSSIENLDKEKANLDRLLKWESQVRDNEKILYKDIIAQLEKNMVFTFPFAKQIAKKLLEDYRNKEMNYTGNVMLVIKKADLSKAQTSRSSKSYCKCTCDY